MCIGKGSFVESKHVSLMNCNEPGDQPISLSFVLRSACVLACGVLILRQQVWLTLKALGVGEYGESYSRGTERG